MPDAEQLDLDKITSLINGAASGLNRPPNICCSVLDTWTEHFSESKTLWREKFWNVYRGWYPDRNKSRNGEVVVKRFNMIWIDPSSREEMMSSFFKELHVLTELNHPNIIKLLAYSVCQNGNLCPSCFVFEEVSLGGLDEQWQDDKKALKLNWDTRLRIAKEIGSALKFLHENERYPTYHLDVRSANVALTSNLVSKLVDFGLMTSTDSRDKTKILFGSALYQCPEYTNSGIYDVKSEVYSFGVFLTELLRGKLQGKPDLITLFTIDNGLLIPDPRLPDLPIYSVESWVQSIRLCICDRENRAPHIEEVLEVLETIAMTECGKCNNRNKNGISSTSAAEVIVKYEEEIKKLETKLELALGAQDGAHVSGSTLVRECLVCFEAAKEQEGVLCSNGHFLCDNCFGSENLTTQLECESRGRFIRHGCRVVCGWCLPTVNVVSERIMALHLDEEMYAKYRSVCTEVAVNEHIREAEERYRKEIDKLYRELEALRSASDAQSEKSRLEDVQRHRTHIVDNILTLKCPRSGCGMALLDFEGCFAITCGSCGCGFCAWCLKDCGDDAHQHVMACALNRNAGGIGGSFEDFEDTHRQRMGREVSKYLHVEVSMNIVDLVREAVRADLQRLGVPIFHLGTYILQMRSPI